MPAPVAKRPTRPVVVAKKTGLPAWVKMVLGAAGVLVAGHFYLLHRIGEVADGLVQTLSMFANASHRGAYYTWDGNLGFRRLSIQPQTGGASSLVVQEVELQTPGWIWVLRAFNPAAGGGGLIGPLGRSLGVGDLPAADRLRLLLRGVELDLNSLLPPGMPDMGFASGALFETEGCSNLRYFVPLQLRSDLGLPYVSTDLAIGYTVTGNDQLRVDFSYESPGLAASRFEVDWRTRDPRRFLDGGDAEQKPLAMRLVFEDRGFLAARNRWCAEQAGVDADEFQRRHITTVRRVFEIYGLRLSPESEEVYSDFARSGGTLTVEATWPATRLDQYPPADRLRLMQPQIWRNSNRRQPLGLEFIRPRPLPAAFAGSVYDLLARKEDLADANAPAPLTALGSSIGKLAAPAASAAPEESQPAPEAVPEQSGRKRPSTPQPTSIGLATENLIAAIGERVEVRTDDGRSRVGTLVSVDPKVLTIQVAVSGGKADLSFTRARVRAVIANPQLR
ncbi:MAG: hypothetical protein DYH17_02185 [Xanthomonadales bacterium PRO6]|nr:hypothetical protein [Xanthomonadales bacterium]MCE7930174.1 hypothetical protein [Xanthomonadales bacterium PRO6]